MPNEVYDRFTKFIWKMSLSSLVLAFVDLLGSLFLSCVFNIDFVIFARAYFNTEISNNNVPMNSSILKVLCWTR